jgi:succinate dehydrogenase / fumarate reductase cytochrome b subunit
MQRKPAGRQDNALLPCTTRGGAKLTAENDGLCCGRERPVRQAKCLLCRWNPEVFMSSSDRPVSKRPLSPHLQIYRWQWTMTLSILHRSTGIALTAGSLYLVWWLVAIAAGPEAYATISAFSNSIVGKLMLLGWTFSLFYHLSNGIRHLVWDAGIGLDLKTSYMSACLVIALAVALTVIAWVAAYVLR